MKSLSQIKNFITNQLLKAEETYCDPRIDPQILGATNEKMALFWAQIKDLIIQVESTKNIDPRDYPKFIESVQKSASKTASIIWKENIYPDAFSKIMYMHVDFVEADRSKKTNLSSSYVSLTR